MADQARKERQSSFGLGEWDPELWSRSDVEGYGNALRRAFNFLPLPRGQAANRPGSIYGEETYGSGVAVARRFSFSDDDSLALVFSDRRLRFVRAGVGVDVTPAPKPWRYMEAVEEDGLREYGGVYYRLLFPGGAPDGTAAHPPMDIANNPDPFWEVADPIAPVAYLDTPYAAADLPNLRFSQVGDVVTITCAGHPERELRRTAADTFRLIDISYTAVPCNFGGAAYGPAIKYPLPVSDASNPPKPWRVLITTVYEDEATGNLIESAPIELTESLETQAGVSPPDYTPRDLPDTWVVTAAKPVKYVTYPPRGAIAPEAYPYAMYRIHSWRVYRGIGDAIGYVGFQKHPGNGIVGGVVASWFDTSLDFTDNGDEPNYAIRPPQGRNPFYFPGDATATPARAARTERPKVSCFHEQRRLLANTDERKGTIILSESGAYTKFDKYLPVVATDAFERELASMRFEEIRHLVPGEPLVALTSGGEWTIEGSGSDTALAPASFRARERTEHGCNWTVPVRVGSTVVFVGPKGNVVRGFGVGPNGLEDEELSAHAAHFLASATVVELAYAEDPWGVVWAALSDGSLLSLTVNRRFKTLAWARHIIAGGTVESICTVPEGGEDRLYMVVRRTVGGDTKRYVERLASRKVTDVKEGVFLDSSVTARGVATNGDGTATVTGLGHLEAQTVVALADGAVVRVDAGGNDLVVTGGQVVLPDAEGAGFGVVHVGLSYDAELQTLDSAGEKGREKTVAKAWIEVTGSKGGKIGTDFDTLQEWPSRKVSDGYEVQGLRTQTYEVPLKGQFAKSGSVAIRQSDPLPLTVVAITREVTYGG